MGEGGWDSEWASGKRDALGFPGDWHLHASLVLPLPQILSLAAHWPGGSTPVSSSIVMPPGASTGAPGHLFPFAKAFDFALGKERIFSLPESTQG